MLIAAETITIATDQGAVDGSHLAHGCAGFDEPLVDVS
jgi:hypothetical protein